jgi:NitT/TauT family transport system permease protein
VNRKSNRWAPASVAVTQIVLLCAVLAAWEYLPKIPTVRALSHLFDPFFVSSPTRIFSQLLGVTTGRNDSWLIWPYMWPTLEASVIGTGFGMGAGAVAGLVLSDSQFLSAVFRPFVVAMNAVPRIALIPLVILLVGPTFAASIVICFLVVFFVAFFNAFEGGRSMSPQVLQNARILGAGHIGVMLHIRLPYVLAWTMAALPLGLTFGLITVVTGEILTGQLGLGKLVAAASAGADATLTFTVVITLAAVGLAIVSAADLVRRRVLHWWITA